MPTLAEMARIKAWLLATRYTTRDYLDTSVLFERLGESGVREALAELDAIYPQTSVASVLAEVVEHSVMLISINILIYNIYQCHIMPPSTVS